MIEPFSAGYYITELHVRPHEGSWGKMSPPQFNELSKNVYGKHDMPPILKIADKHFPVQADKEVQLDAIQLPDTQFDISKIRGMDGRQPVLIVKPERALQMIQLSQLDSID